MTPEQFAASTGASVARAAQHLPHLVAAMEEFGIDTLARQAAFLAQIGHESQYLIHTRELWGPTSAQQRYERNRDAPWPESPEQAKLQAFAVNRLAYTLGNTEPGDGSRFRGRGLIQITGRANYAACGKALGVDLLADPVQLERSPLAQRSAAWFWQSRNLNRFADSGDFETLTRRINGGLNGYADRLRLWEKAKAVLA